MSKKALSKEEKELRRLIREQEADMNSRGTKIQYQGRSKELQPNYKPGDSEILAVELENFVLRAQDSKDKVENNEA